MKKYRSFFISLVFVLTLAACGKKADPIILPQANGVTSIDITNGENTVSCSDKSWISEVLAGISNSEPTGRLSVQDVPLADNYIRIDIRHAPATTSLFAYEDGGKYYIEQPYHGIYRIDGQLYGRLREASSVTACGTAA